MVGGGFYSSSLHVTIPRHGARAGLGGWKGRVPVEVKHLEVWTFCGEVSGPLEAPDHFLPGWILLSFHFRSLTTPLRSKTLHLSVPAALLAGQSSPHKENDPGERRCVGGGGHGTGSLSLRSKKPMILKSGEKRSHQEEASSYGRDDGLERGICGLAREGWLWSHLEEKGRNLDLCLSSLGFRGFSGSHVA